MQEDAKRTREYDVWWRDFAEPIGPAMKDVGGRCGIETGDGIADGGGERVHHEGWVTRDADSGELWKDGAERER